MNTLAACCAIVAVAYSADFILGTIRRKHKAICDNSAIDQSEGEYVATELDTGEPLSLIEQAKQERRFKIYHCDVRILAGFFGGRVKIVEGQIPADAEVFRINYDIETDSIRVVFVSADFAPVKEGCHFPCGDHELAFQYTPPEA